VDNLWISRRKLKQQEGLFPRLKFSCNVENPGRRRVTARALEIALWQRVDAADMKFAPHGKKRVAKPGSDATLAG
jgi:hypothetical protein